MTCPRCQSRHVVTDVSARRHWCLTCGHAWAQGAPDEPLPPDTRPDSVWTGSDVRDYDKDDE